MNNDFKTNIYCAVDVETPNRHNDSICQIAVVKVNDAWFTRTTANKRISAIMADSGKGSFD